MQWVRSDVSHHATIALLSARTAAADYVLTGGYGVRGLVGYTAQAASAAAADTESWCVLL
jgi:hypothetical protein